MISFVFLSDLLVRLEQFNVMAAFKYDVIILIELVESKPCLWDKTDESSKNKILRNKSWQEICEYMEDNYDSLSLEDKKRLDDLVRTKWENIRDAFLRSLRTKSGQAAKKSYIYSEHLQFLLKTAKKNETTCSLQLPTKPTIIHEQLNEIFETEEYLPISPPLPSPTVSGLNLETDADHEQPVQIAQPHISQLKTKKKNKKRELDPIETEIMNELKKSRPTHELNDHELIMMSFVPHIRDMDDSELMDLQMEILRTIKCIKNKRNLVLIPPVSYTPSDLPSTATGSSSGASSASMFKRMYVAPPSSSSNDSTVFICLQPGDASDNNLPHETQDI